MLKKDDAEHAIPEPLRETCRRIAAAFAAGDFELRRPRIDGVMPIDAETARDIADMIAAYGSPLTCLDEATWERSIYRWMDGYWEVLVDLSTDNEPVSDLTLHARLIEADEPYWEIESVHVP